MVRLFTVKITSYAVVIADDKTHAIHVARGYIRDIVSDDGAPSVECTGEVCSERDLVDDWDLECFPYGGDGNSRIGELIGAASTPQPPAPPADHP